MNEESVDDIWQPALSFQRFNGNVDSFQGDLKP